MLFLKEPQKSLKMYETTWAKTALTQRGVIEHANIAAEPTLLLKNGSKPGQTMLAIK